MIVNSFFKTKIAMFV